MNIPWPWTVTVNDRTDYYEDKKKAVTAAQNALKISEPINVGCLAIPVTAAADIEEALDPKSNVAVAAKVLAQKYQQLRDWINATAAYHSSNPEEQLKYLERIEKSWNKIVEKVAAARGVQICGSIPTLLNSDLNIKPKKGCLYSDREGQNKLYAFQVTRNNILVRTQSYEKRHAILLKDNEHEENTVDDSIIDPGVFEYAGVFTYMTAVGVEKSVYSFRRIK